MKRLIRFKMAVRLGLIVINLPPLLNLNNLFVSETHSKSCAIDLRTKFFSFSHYGKKIQKLSVKLMQSELAPSVNLKVYQINQD